MSERRILAAFAHPDDESFGLGGLIARYIDEGADFYLICTTNGDVGTIDPELLAGYESHAARRLAELDCASEKLGFKAVFKFGYRDSGMMGSEENNDPNCSWAVWQNNPDELIRRTVEVIRQVRPQVVITFNKYGGYGHPDHIAIQRATKAAFDLAGDPTYITEGLQPYRPQKLYYTSIPKFIIQFGILTTRLRGKNPRKLGRNNDIDIVRIVEEAEPVHTRIDIAKYMQAWTEANACHESQGGGRTSFIPRWLRRMMGLNQTLTRVYPAPPTDKIDEYDLFTGVTFDEPTAVDVQS